MTSAAQALTVEHEPKRQEISEAPSMAPASETAAIFQIIERAARDPNVDIDKMQRLMEMHDKVQATRAKTAYAAAFAEMQPDLPEIPEHGQGHGAITYALWEDINDLIKPVLKDHGFGISFRTGRDGQAITVTAVLSHREGHSEETTMLLPLDTSGSKNAVQAVGSSTSYGKRYTAAALLNLTSRGEDDDGKKGGGKAIDPTQPPTKSSASLKRKDENGEDAWDRLIKELRADLQDCTLVNLPKLRADYRERARADRWPRAWLDALANEFDQHEDLLEKRETERDLINDEVPF
jgi:hypothetical protein